MVKRIRFPGRRHPSPPTGEPFWKTLFPPASTGEDRCVWWRVLLAAIHPICIPGFGPWGGPFLISLLWQEGDVPMKFNRKISRFFIFASAALLLALLAQPAPAIGTKYWVGPKRQYLWTNPNNWSNLPEARPGPGSQQCRHIRRPDQHQHQDGRLRYHVKYVASG